MPPVVHELSVLEIASEKLARRGITVEEVLQLQWNKHVVRDDPHAPAGTDRHFMLGETNGGRRLTMVIEATADPTTWEVVTGWQSGRTRLR